ncbi:MAG: SPOR domain-containing protein [Candidatus Tectomicrobia bacterium]|nr:SPOR domain-containing protein [Candidatus Tectomicrobia bacterium]
MDKKGMVIDRSSGRSRRARLGGWVLTQFQVALALLGVAVGLALFFGLGFLLGIWYQANEDIRPNDRAIALAEEQLQREQTPKAPAKEMTFYSTLTTREEESVASPVAAQPQTTPSEWAPPATASGSQAPDGATGPIRTDESQSTLPERPVPEQEARGQASARSEPGQPENAAPPPVTSTAPAQTAALSASPPAPPDARFYTVQVGSFRRANDAQRLQQQLAQKGYAARLLIISLPGKGLWHRVRVGTFSERAEADQMAQRLRSRENMTVLVTSESS